MRFKWILGLCAAILALLPAVGVPAQGTTTTVTLLHFSDYHSHAVPFYSEGAAEPGRDRPRHRLSEGAAGGQPQPADPHRRATR